MPTKQASKATETAPQETKFTKAELLAIPSITGAQRDFFQLALKADKKYSYNEALQEVKQFKGGLF